MCVLWLTYVNLAESQLVLGTKVFKRNLLFMSFTTETYKNLASPIDLIKQN